MIKLKKKKKKRLRYFKKHTHHRSFQSILARCHIRFPFVAVVVVVVVAAEV